MYPLGHHPSKALRHAVSRIIEFNQNPLYNNSRTLSATFPDILRHADNVISQQTRMRQGFERNQCKLFAGDALHRRQHRQRQLHGRHQDTIRADHIVIACGSRPTIRPASISITRASTTAIPFSS